MAKPMDDLIDQYDRGVIGRRELVRGLFMLAAAPAAALVPSSDALAQGAAGPIATVRNINHVHFDVSDLQRSADFYAAMFGATVKAKSPTFWTVDLPTKTPGLVSWFSMSKAPQPKPSMDGSGVQPGHYAHMGIGIDIPDVKATARLSAEINKRFPFAQAKPTGPWTETGENDGSRSIYMRDPDGLLLQLIRPTDDGFLTKPMMKR